MLQLLLLYCAQLADWLDRRHPFDQQNTRILRWLPGLELIARNMLGMTGLPLGRGSPAAVFSGYTA